MSFIKTLVQEAFKQILLEDAYDDFADAIISNAEIDGEITSLNLKRLNELQDDFKNYTKFKPSRARNHQEAARLMSDMCRYLMSTNIKFRSQSGELLQKFSNVHYWTKLAKSRPVVNIFISTVGETIKYIKRQHAEKVAKDDYDVVFKSPMAVVFKPNHRAASCRLGAGTQWCISARAEGNAFDMYQIDYDIYIIHTKNEKFAILLDKSSRTIFEVQGQNNAYHQKTPEQFAEFFKRLQLATSQDVVDAIMSKIRARGYEKYMSLSNKPTTIVSKSRYTLYQVHTSTHGRELLGRGIGNRQQPTETTQSKVVDGAKFSAVFNISASNKIEIYAVQKNDPRNLKLQGDAINLLVSFIGFKETEELLMDAGLNPSRYMTDVKKSFNRLNFSLNTSGMVSIFTDKNESVLGGFKLSFRNGKLFIDGGASLNNVGIEPSNVGEYIRSILEINYDISDRDAEIGKVVSKIKNVYRDYKFGVISFDR